ncbi:hypothetical protein BS78_08G120200 [Paspalum vaginatum]|nr:hypothetical protein BS78_08G120200 [Paspalum vaginatum]
MELLEAALETGLKKKNTKVSATVNGRKQSSSSCCPQSLMLQVIKRNAKRQPGDWIDSITRLLHRAYPRLSPSLTAQSRRLLSPGGVTLTSDLLFPRRHTSALRPPPPAASYCDGVAQRGRAPSLPARASSPGGAALPPPPPLAAQPRAPTSSPDVTPPRGRLLVPWRCGPAHPPPPPSAVRWLAAEARREGHGGGSGDERRGWGGRR